MQNEANGNRDCAENNRISPLMTAQFCHRERPPTDEHDKNLSAHHDARYCDEEPIAVYPLEKVERSLNLSIAVVSVSQAMGWVASGWANLLVHIEYLHPHISVEYRSLQL